MEKNANDYMPILEKRDKIIEKFRNKGAQENIPFDEQEIKIYNSNNGNYSTYKYSWIHPGQRFQFRSRHKISSNKIFLTDKVLEKRTIWLNYTGSMGKDSFLKLPTHDSFPPEISKKIAKFFCPWLNTVVITEPMLIFHFPVNYDNLKDIDSFTAHYEGLVKQICVINKHQICTDGYTLDFLYKPFTGLLKGIEPVKGFRELCILYPRPGDDIKLISSEYLPLE